MKSEHLVDTMKVIFPFFLAIFLICVVELAISTFGIKSMYNTDFFDFAPLNKDVYQKHVIYDKFVYSLPSLPSTVVQVGDSSGFYGVIPEKISQIAPSLSYLNLSCCGDVGWNGYYHQAELAMKRVPKPKILVLHVTPWWSPAAREFYGENRLAESIKNTLVKDNWYKSIRIPSMDYRLRVTNLVFHGKWKDDFTYEESAPKYPSLSVLRDAIVRGRGYIPIPVQIGGQEVGTCKLPYGYRDDKYFGLLQGNSLYHYLKAFELLAEYHGAHFILITNPVSCSIAENDVIVAEIEEQVAKFKKDFPKATIAFPFLREWSNVDDFADPFHLSANGALKHSYLIGEFLNSKFAKY